MIFSHFVKCLGFSVISRIAWWSQELREVTICLGITRNDWFHRLTVTYISTYSIFQTCDTDKIGTANDTFRYILTGKALEAFHPDIRSYRFVL